MQLTPDVIDAIENPRKEGCAKCRFVGCKACRGYTLAEKQIYERMKRENGENAENGENGGEREHVGEDVDVDEVVPETREKEVEEVVGVVEGHVEEGAHVDVGGMTVVNGQRMLTENDFTSSLQGKDVMVFWGQRFKAWYRATVVRFDDKARKASLHYPRDGYKESVDWRKVKTLIAGGRIKLVVGEVVEEPEESAVSQNDDDELDLSQSLSQEPGLRYVGREEFGDGLVGRSLMVFWGRGFNAWFRATVERFDDKGRMRLYYVEDRYREIMDARKFGNLVEKARIKVVEGDWGEEVEMAVAGVGVRVEPRHGCSKCRFSRNGCKACTGYTKAAMKSWQQPQDAKTSQKAQPAQKENQKDKAKANAGAAPVVCMEPMLTPTRFEKVPYDKAGCSKCRYRGCPTCRNYTKAEYTLYQAQQQVLKQQQQQEGDVSSASDGEIEEADASPMSPLAANKSNKGKTDGSEPLLTPTRFVVPPERDGCPKCRYRGCRSCVGYTKAELRRWQEQEGILPSPQAAKERSKAAKSSKSSKVVNSSDARPQYTKEELRKWQEKEGIVPSPVPSKKGAPKRQRSPPSSSTKAPSSRRPNAKDAKPTKGTKGTKGAKGASHAAAQKSLRFLTIEDRSGEDERFELGDDVFIALNDDVLELNLEQEDESFVCHECHGHSEPANQLLECAKCMHAYHQHCLKSPLSSIPEGLWICDDCLSGERVEASRPLTSAREFFLQQKGLALGRIESIGMENGEYVIACRWFCLPEETHVGRQSNHTAREVFLASHKQQVEASAIYRRAKVVSLSEFSSSGDVDEDMFICDYEYDYQWKRFYRISEWDQQNDYGFGSDSDDDEARDATFKLTLDLMRADGGGHVRGKKKRKLQGGHFGATLQLGAGDIPDAGRFSAAALAGGSLALEDDSDVIKASRALSLATIPEYMPCREEQQEQIEDFMRNAIASSSSSSRNKAGKCLYISGIPGTGKTACVMDIVRNMTQSGNRNFHFIEINGLQLPSPMHVYSKLCEALTGETVGPSTAMVLLEDLFTGKSQKEFRQGHHIIVMLDEMDSIVNKSQKALYNLFDWPSNPSSNLSIIGIANTMDLPERLHPRIASRLAANKVVFHPYQKEDLQTIVQARLEAFTDTLFDDAALQYAARKVANCSGDLRRCLELCRRALEVALRRADGVTEGLQVRARDIDAAAKEAYNSPSIKMLAGCTRDQLMLMAAMCLECQYAGAENDTVILEDVFHRLNGSFPGYSVALPVLLHNVSNLGSSKLILCDGVSNRLGCKISLNVVKEDLKYVLTSDEHPRSAVEANAGSRIT